jgi:imidazole glycerol-phosphate synthase subunit HisH
MITIISYGSGNIKSFVNIYKKFGIKVRIAEKESDLNDDEKIIIPGVGSFDETMKKINKSGMRDKLDFYALKKKIPILGICVGMQIMGKSSEEGSLPGLNWIDGVVKKFPQNLNFKVPHMGWNLIKKKKSSKILEDLDDDSRFYFLHSFYFQTISKDYVLAQTFYNFEFSSIINFENIYGIQFHPEKSHLTGLTILKNFINL